MKTFEFARDPALSTGSALVEYAENELTDLICENLPLLQVGTTVLSVQKADSSLKLSTPAPPSRVISLLNMVTVDELSVDSEYAEIVEDVREECSKFGPIEELVCAYI
eukprot:tig00020918_g15879.t1